MKRFYSFLTIFLILLQVIPAASAEPTIDMNRKGSITVKVAYNQVPLDGMKLNCNRIGEATLKDNVPGFNCYYSSDLFFTEEINDRSDYRKDYMEKIFKLIPEFYDDRIENLVDKEGKIVFKDLAPGLYYIYQTESYFTKENYYSISPFLVTIPYDGEYDVDAKSKLSIDTESKETTPPTEPTKPPEKLPQTGQLRWPIPVMACSGMVCFILGWYLCFARRRDSYEK